MDKLAYMLGTSIIILFSFILGRYPNTLIFKYHTLVIILLLLGRYVQYTLLRWHMYLIDFCYFGNFTIIYFITFAPKDVNLFIVCFVFANGPLAAAVAAFRNSLVYHKIDYLTSLFIHALPMILLTHIRWFVLFD